MKENDKNRINNVPTHNAKKGFWLDILFLALGVATLLLLFMPEKYIEYRYAGYVGVGLFLAFLMWREARRKKKNKTGETAERNDSETTDGEP